MTTPPVKFSAAPAVHPDDASYLSDDDEDRPAEYHEEDGHVVLAGGAAIPTSKGPSKKVRRRRRFLALLLTLTVFIVALTVGAQFLKPLLGGDTVADFQGPGTGEVVITVPPGAGPKSVARITSFRTRTWWRMPTRSSGTSWPPAGRWLPETSPCATK